MTCTRHSPTDAAVPRFDAAHLRGTWALNVTLVLLLLSLHLKPSRADWLRSRTCSTASALQRRVLRSTAVLKVSDLCRACLLVLMLLLMGLSCQVGKFLTGLLALVSESKL